MHRAAAPAPALDDFLEFDAHADAKDFLSGFTFGGYYGANAPMRDDAELLRRYVEFRSEADFTAFVERHLNVVYHAALRRMGGRSDLAQDVTQQVFTALARDADRLSRHEALTGWLYTAARHAAHQILRAERRRQHREQEAD